jgi:hypothetical protein
MVKPPKKFSYEEQRAANGFRPINSFFRPKSCDTVTRGRRAQKRGKKRAADDDDAAAAAAAADANDVGSHDDTRARTKEARKQKKQREIYLLSVI